MSAIVHRLNILRFLIYVVPFYGLPCKGSKMVSSWDFLGGPVVKNLYSQCRGPSLDPWLGN